MKIEMPRGDLKNVSFSIKSNGVITDIEFDEIYVTFKRNEYVSDFLFQKKLTDGTIIKREDNTYYFTIYPEDTDNLTYGKYVFDIEIIKVGSIKKTTTGILNVTKEVTFITNEE